MGAAMDLKKMNLPGVGSLKRRASKDMVALDLSGERVRLVRAVKEVDESVVIEHCLERKFPEDAEDEICLFLTECMTQLGITTKDVLCVLPSPMFISKNVDMPSNDREEISKIVDLQAGRYTPYSRDEISIDYICMDSAGQHYTNVLLFIVNRKVVDRCYRIADRLGLNIERMVIAPEALSAFFDAIDETKSELSAVAGIHITEEYSDLTVVDNNQMVFVRSISIGASHFRKNREQAEQEFVSELSKSIVAYQDQGVGKPIKSIVFAGLLEELGFLETMLKASVLNTQIPDLEVKLVQYPQLFQAAENAFSSAGTDSASTFFDVAGALVARESMKIDLIPKEMKMKRQVREGGREIITLGILIMSCLILASTYLAVKVYLRSEVIHKLESLEAGSANDARVLERASTKTRVVRNLLKNRGKGLYVFERVTSLVGNDIYLNSFSYDHEGPLLLAGTANSMSRVYAFVTDLEESNYFSSVKTKSTKSRKVGQSDVADFEIECELVEDL